ADQAAVRRIAEELAVLDDHLATQNRRDRPPVDVPALPHAVVGRVEITEAQALADTRVDHGDVGVAPRRDRTLLRIHAEDRRRIRRGDGDEALERHPALDDALGPGDPYALFSGRVAADRVLDGPAGELERALAEEDIGGDGGERAVHEPAPERLGV